MDLRHEFLNGSMKSRLSLQEQNKKTGFREELKLCMIHANHVGDIGAVQEKNVFQFSTLKKAY